MVQTGGAGHDNPEVSQAFVGVETMAQLENAITNASSGDTIKIAPGTYIITDSTLDLAGLPDGVTIDGGNKESVIFQANDTDFHYISALPAITAVGIGAATEGDLSVTTDTAGDAANWSVGGLITIRSGEGSTKAAETNIVTSVNAGTGVVGVKYPLASDFDAAATADYSDTGDKLKGFTLKNVTMDVNGDDVAAKYILAFTFCEDLTLENIDIINCESNTNGGVFNGYSLGTKIKNFKILGQVDGRGVQSYYNRSIIIENLTCLGDNVSNFTANDEEAGIYLLSNCFVSIKNYYACNWRTGLFSLQSRFARHDVRIHQCNKGVIHDGTTTYGNTTDVFSGITYDNATNYQTDSGGSVNTNGLIT